MGSDVLKDTMKHGGRKPARVGIIARAMIAAEQFELITDITGGTMSEFAVG